MIGLVGPIVEEVLENVGGSVAAQTQDGSDFAINNLFFKIVSTDDKQYQRATAQFQKDQLDTGHTAGDQSLTGWWTRGQFSFHKGAGITYYDTGTTVRLNEDLTPLNRFTTGDGVAPFKPGRVTCQKSFSEYPTTVGAVTYVDSVGANLVVLDGTTARYGDFAGTVTDFVPSSGANVVAIATAPTRFYVLLANGTISAVDPGTGTETHLYTGLAGGRGIWYAKSRLVVADSDGKWYQLATNPTGAPAAVTSSDVIFTGIDWGTTSCVADSPGPILVGNGNRIFALSLDSTGSIPNLSAPVQVAELPPGETVSAIAHHLGFVVLVTGAGVRAGVLADNGQVTYGPILVERATATTTPPATSIARYSTKAGVVVDNAIVEIDLSEQVGQGLEFAWVYRGDPFTGGETAAGVTTLEINTQVAWANGGIWRTGTALATGTLTTGYHRFATLEPKRFDSVRVHGEGTAGTIEVIRVDASGTETSLLTIDMGVTHVEDVDLRMSGSVAAIGLKFVLTPSGTTSPVLLGYQLRALPDPRRQRMIRVPLEMKDLERRQPVRASGKKGSAWTRMQALETLEETGSVVSFRDFRTGEAGTAYIESVEFVNKTPPTSGSTGFGGVCFVTLRKLL